MKSGVGVPRCPGGDTTRQRVRFFRDIWNLYGDLYVSAAEHHAWLRGDQPAELDARDLARLGPSTRGLADAPTWGERPW